MLPYVFAWTFVLVSLFIAAIVFVRAKMVPPEIRASQMAEHWMRVLGLSNDQTEKVHSIMLERERQWNEDHTHTSVPAGRSAWRRQLRNHRQRLYKVLTPQQRKQARKLLPEMRRMPRTGKGMHRRPAARQGMGPAYGRP